MEGLEALLADEATDMAAKLGEVVAREITGFRMASIDSPRFSISSEWPFSIAPSSLRSASFWLIRMTIRLLPEIYK